MRLPRRTPWTLAALSLFAGCAAGTGIVPIGPDTYAASEMRAPAVGGGAEARRVLLAESDFFCRQQNQVFVPLMIRPDGDPYTPYYPTAFDATFRCLPAGDPAAAQFEAQHPHGLP
jgi:hypothetical protein